jgi:YD repeat-containing protein
MRNATSQSRVVKNIRDTLDSNYAWVVYGRGTNSERWVRYSYNGVGSGNLASKTTACGMNPSAGAAATPADYVADSGDRVAYTYSNGGQGYRVMATTKRSTINPATDAWSIVDDKVTMARDSFDPRRVGSTTRLVGSDSITTSYVYDAEGRTTKQTSYTEFGDVWTETDETNRTLTSQYDSLRRRTSVTNDQAETSYTLYDQVTVGGGGCSCAGTTSLPTAVFSPDGTYTQFIYDARQHKIAEIRGMGANFDDTQAVRIDYEYDQLGHLLRETRPHKSLYANRKLLTLPQIHPYYTLHQYDALGRRIQTRSVQSQFETSAGVPTTERRVWYWTYDAAGNVLTSEVPHHSGSRGGTGITTRTYDGRNHLLTSTEPATAAVGSPALAQLALTRPTSYEYNALGQLTKLTTPAVLGQPAAG